jgi:hypothetical protein
MQEKLLLEVVFIRVRKRHFGDLEWMGSSDGKHLDLNMAL